MHIYKMALENNQMVTAQMELWDHSQCNWKHTSTHRNQRLREEEL